MSNLKKHGIREDYFDKYDYESKSNKRMHELCLWIIKNGKEPGFNRPKDVEEKKFGFFLYNKKKARKK